MATFLKKFLRICGAAGVAFCLVANIARADGSTYPISSPFEAESLNNWIPQETTKSVEAMLQNISPPGTARGVVIASPSRTPDYYYHWVRDGALIMDAVVSLDARSTDAGEKQRYESMLWDYTNFSRRNQLTRNPSGEPDGLGLGEPKFNVDGSPFNRPWGRPQNDGPAIRANTLIRFANLLIDEGHEDWVRSGLYDGKNPTRSVIKADLEYVSHHWVDPSFDLWEEVRGEHFFTLMVQRRAMVDGAALANRLGDVNAANWYLAQASSIESEIFQHWDSSQGHLVATLDFEPGYYKWSGLDIAIILGALHGWTDDGFSREIWDRVLATVPFLKSAFRDLYGVNQYTKDSEGEPIALALGRYPEDRYNGYTTTSQGNPWFLATLAMAELNYRTANRIEKDGSFRINQYNLPFLRNLDRSVVDQLGLRSGMVVSLGDSRFYGLVQALRDQGDAYVRRVKLHVDAEGSMSEQINRSSGYMQGASDLSWNYAAFLTTMWSR